MTDIELFGRRVPTYALDLGYIVLAVAVALVLYAIAMYVLRRIARSTAGVHDEIFVRHGARPLKWILVALAFAFVRDALHLSPTIKSLWSQAAGMVVPLLIGWFAIAMIRAFSHVVEVEVDGDKVENIAARRLRTRSHILTRIAILVIGFITVCLMLLSIPSVRSIGVTLMASAGLVALAVGAAAQPALKNLISGIQMAFTEPIRIGDVVIIDNEWGTIEDIRLTYVIVAVWDERRLVVPVRRFLDNSFENWTRRSTELHGTVFFYLDPTADIARLRDKAEKVVRGNHAWDGRAVGVVVTDIRPEAIEVRVLGTAADADATFVLRCDIREAMLTYIRDEMPEALPRGRTEIGGREWRREQQAPPS